jgi:signal transduction histidine kinase
MELYSHQFFSFFEQPVADELRKRVTLETFPVGTIIFEEGEPSECLYLVLTGKVELCKRGSERSYLTIAFAGANDFFGELGVLDGSARCTRAVAVEQTILARVAREPVLSVLRHTSGKTVIDMFNRTIQHLRATDERYVSAVVRKEKMTLVGEMANTIIHDLRNPCHGVSMASVLINQLHSDDKTQRCCKIIQDQVDRMVLMVEELLDFSRGTYQLHRQTISLAALMERFGFLNREYLQQNGIVLELRQAALSIEVDANKLLRVLQNLVYNAADALKNGNGRIIISGRSVDGAVEICVQDNGPGIPEEIKDRLFEPFVTSGKTGGTGLGLAIAKSIVEAHGGRILCHSTPGAGAAFYVRLPGA